MEKSLVRQTKERKTMKRKCKEERSRAPVHVFVSSTLAGKRKCKEGRSRAPIHVLVSQ